MSSTMTALTLYAEKALYGPPLDVDAQRKALQDSSWADVRRVTLSGCTNHQAGDTDDG